MLMQMIDCMIEQDPSLSARRTIDMRRYIVNRWSRTHEDPIDEDAVALFLCDENRGTLTDEQRLFARERREELKACYRNAMFRMFQCGEMMRRHRLELRLADGRNLPECQGGAGGVRKPRE